jgi:LuxR family transcriptional regulator, maltose regulon positive regulatory protein
LRANRKFVIPQRRPNEVERSQLLTKLGNDRKLTLITGSTGYGKTTLLAQFARLQTQPVVWLSLSLDEAEPLNLANALAKAISFAAPHFFFELPHNPSTGDLKLGSELASAVNAWDENLIFIIEGLHHLTRDSSRLMETFISELGEGHRAVVSHYGAAEAKFLRLLASDDLVSITEEELRLSADEVSVLAKLVGLTNEVDVSSADGWPLMISLMLKTGHQGSTNELMAELLEGLTEDLRRSLPEASVLDVWSYEGASLLGCRLPVNWIAETARSGLPITKLNEDRYVPHRLLQQTLELLLMESSKRYIELHSQAAEILQSRGELLYSVAHYFKAGQAQKSTALLEQIARQWKLRSEWKTVREFLENYPLSLLTPELTACYGISLLETGERERAEQILHQQVSVGTPCPFAHYGLALIEFRKSNFDVMLVHASDGLRLRPSNEDSIYLSEAKTLALLFMHKEEEAHKVAEEGYELAKKIGEASLYIKAATVYCYSLQTQGRDEQKVIQVLFELVNTAFESKNFVKAFTPLDQLCFILDDVGRTDEIIAFVNEMIEIGYDEYPLALPYMLTRRAEHHMSKRDFDAAINDLEAAVKEGERFNDANRFSIMWTNLMVCYFRSRYRQKGLRAFETGKAYWSQSDVKEWGEENVRSNEAVCSFFMDDLVRSQKLFRESVQFRSEQPTRHSFSYHSKLAESYLFMAEIHRRLGELRFEDIQIVMQHLDSRGNDSVLGNYVDLFPDLFHECVERGWYRDRLRLVLNKYLNEVARADQLVLKAFGESHITVNGHVVTLTNKATEVVAYLILHGKTKADQLADAVWPSHSIEAARNNLKVQIRHLRIAFSKVERRLGGLLVWNRNDDSYSFVDSLTVTSDVGFFEAALMRNGLNTRENFLDYYTGEFLSSLKAQWVEELRNYYRNLLIAESLALAKSYLSDMQKSLCIYQKLIARDPSCVQAYQELARIFRDSNNPLAEQLMLTSVAELREGNLPRLDVKLLENVR